MPVFDTIFPADSIEFCPHPKAQNIFVCGTYKLDEPLEPGPTNREAASPVDVTDEILDKAGSSLPQHRRGQCLVFDVQYEPTSVGERKLRQIQALNLPAVLDIKWCHRSSATSAVLGIADSEGNVTLYEWQDEEQALSQVDLVSCAPSDVLCLSLDWSNRRNPGTDLGSLVVSLSNGSVCLLRPNDAASLSVTDSWVAHDYEPWIAAWNYWDTNVIYSGGDDLKMKGWDIRQGFSQPLFVNKRFDAGITTIQSHPHIEHVIAVGSYDSTVRLFDTRNPQVPLTHVDTGGGAWRVKWHPSANRQNDLLVACMHDGFKVVRFNPEAVDRTGMTGGGIVKHFHTHDSLAYGVDWSFAGPSDGETLIGSCSFYDHALHLWSG